MHRAIGILTFLLFAGLSFAQKDTAKVQRVNILHADEISFEQKTEGLEQTLIGNIALYQDSTFFYCDTAVILNNHIWAKGNIQVHQGDSTSAYSDSLYYSGNEKLAEMYGKVILDKGQNLLYTDILKYHLAEKRAWYVDGGIMKRQSTSIKSVRGWYDLESNTLLLADSVTVIDTNFVLQADTLEYNTQTNRVYFHGPTELKQEGNSVYCEDGYYDMEYREALFSRNAGFVRGGQRGLAQKMLYYDSIGQFILMGDAELWEGGQLARGDSIVYFQKDKKAELYGRAHFEDETRKVDADFIFYDEASDALATRGQARYAEGDIELQADILEYNDATGHGTAIGSVVWRDTLNDLSIFSDRLDYNKKTEYVKATGKRPYLEIYMEGDTMYVAGDTLISDMDTTGVDTTRRLKIYHDVKIYKSDMQGICDSLVYEQRDSVFRMFDGPILWSDTSQFSADSIDIFLKDKTIDFVVQRKNGMIVNSLDLIYFNQIQGKHIRSEFEGGLPKLTIVDGNAQSIYFATDEEDAYIAANKSICSKIKVRFAEKQIRDISFLAAPKAEMLPMNTPGLKDLRLEGYIWNYESRPKSKEDVLEGMD